MRKVVTVVLIALVALSGCAKKQPVQSGKIEIEVASRFHNAVRLRRAISFHYQSPERLAVSRTSPPSVID